MRDIVRRFRPAIAAFVVACCGLAAIFGSNVQAAEGEFSLQVSPSPLVATLKPGEKTTLDLKVRNVGSGAEKLKIQPRSFSVDGKNGEVKLDDTVPPEIADWITFSAPTFNLDGGQVFDQKVTIDVPKDAGFSYPFALLITRQEDPAQKNQTGMRELKGQVAIFALISIDRPGAVRQLAIDEVNTTQGVYEFLPATINVRFKNTGNTIVQPAGDIFIQRSSSDTTPIDTLAVNKNSGYILPGSFRTLSVAWENGFLVNRQGSSGEYLDWNWSNLGNIRIGYYTAKVVAIYNDGQRDIPVSGEVGFWVIPWRVLLVLLAVVALLAAGLWTIVKRMTRVAVKAGGKSTLVKKIKR